MAVKSFAVLTSLKRMRVFHEHVNYKKNTIVRLKILMGSEKKFENTAQICIYGRSDKTSRADPNLSGG